jgi:drug/metabolite transporter (DMT)-like permease
MLAVLLALAAAAGYGGSDFAAGLAARRASVVRVAVLAEVTSATLLLCVIPFVSSQAPPLASVLWGAAAGASGVAGAMALYLGFRHAAFSVASSVSAVGTAVFSVLAGLALGERPGALSVAGILLAVPAIVGVSAPARQASRDVAPAVVGSQAVAVPGRPGLVAHGTAPPGEHGPAARRSRPAATGRHAAGVGWGLAAGAGFGLFFIGLDRAGSGSDLWPIAISQLAAMVTAIGVAVVTRDLALPPAGTRRLSLLTGAASAAGTAMFFLATHHGLLAITAVIASLYPAGTILLARVLLGERLTRLRLAGLCFAAASVALIAAGGAG